MTYNTNLNAVKKRKLSLTYRWSKPNVRSGCWRETLFASVSLESHISLCSDKGEILYGNPDGLGLHPLGTGALPAKSRIKPCDSLPEAVSNPPPKKTYWGGLIFTNLICRLKGYQDQFLISSLSLMSLADHCISSIWQCCMPNPFIVLSYFFLPVLNLDFKPYNDTRIVIYGNNNK